MDEARNVVLVPNNAIVQTTDVGPAALALGLDIEELDLTQFMRAGRGGFGGERGGGQRGGAAQGSAPPEAANSAATAGAEGRDQEGVMAQLQDLRAKVDAGEITQDSMRTVMASLAGSGGFGGRGGRGGRDRQAQCLPCRAAGHEAGCRGPRHSTPTSSGGRTSHPDDSGRLQAFAFGYGYLNALIHAVNSEV